MHFESPLYCYIYRFIALPSPKIFVFISRAFVPGFCILTLGGLGALVPDLPGLPVYDLLALPMAKCGLTTVAILPADVAPGVAVSATLSLGTQLGTVLPFFFFVPTGL
jgi:hypothetical protein